MKIAIIGAGPMGKRHIEAANHHNIVGICDLKQDALDELKNNNKLDEKMLYTDSSLMMEETQPECVIVATTAPSHFELVKLSILSGAKFVFCEKPMATSLAQCDQMVQLAKENDVHLATNHQMRFMEIYQTAKERLVSEPYGGVTSINISAGNYGLSMNAVHYFEMFRYITDENPFEVTAWFSKGDVPNPRGEQFKDKGGSVRVTTKSGKRLYIDCSLDQGHGLLTIFNSRNGQIMINELTGKMIASVRKDEFRDLPTTRYGMPSDDEELNLNVDIIDITRKTLDSLLSGTGYPSGEDGRQALEVLVAAHISAEENKTINLDLVTLDRNRVFPWA